MNPFKKAFRSINEFLGHVPKKIERPGGSDEPPEPPASATRTIRNPRRPRGPKSGANPLAAAVEAATTPINDARTQIRVEGFSEDGVLNTEGETWDKDNGTFRLTNTEVRTFNCAGGLIKPKDITGMCMLGGKPDAVLRACGQCGLFVCHVHGRFVQGIDGDVWYCLQHVQDHVKIRYWDADAIGKGQPLRIRPFQPSIKPAKRHL